jgi:hypothetical protein
MSVWVCRDCTAAYFVGAPKCPQCGSTDRIEEEEQTMPKITVAGGPSIAGITGGWGEPDEGGEEPSQTPQAPGTASSPSETTPDSEPETSRSGGSKRARTTGSRGGRARTGSSTARTTDTGQTAPTSETGSDEDDEK